MPPVFGPASPSPTRLKSCAGSSGTARAAVAHREQRHLGTGQVLLDQHRVPAVEHGQRVLDGRRPVVGDDDALAGGQTVVLDHIRRAAAGQRVVDLGRRSVTLTAAAVGTPAAAITSLAKAFDPSIRAAAAFGPKTAMPARRSSSAAPLTSGTSGPTTTRSGPTVSARSAMAAGSATSTGCAVASAPVPALPGRDVQLADAGVAAQRPEQGMFTSTGADDENAHVGQSIGPEPDRVRPTGRRAADASRPRADRIAAVVTPLTDARIPEVDELVTAADTEATRLADEADRVLLSDPVPTCPDWTVRQLVEHLGGVHRWAAAIVARGLLQDLPAAGADGVRRPEGPRASCCPGSGPAPGELIDALKAAPDDLRAFVFLKGAPPAKQFWARRQAHETTIHRVDVLAARLGRLPTTAEAAIATDFALDGIDELVTGFVPAAEQPAAHRRAVPDDHRPDGRRPAAWTVAVSDQPPVVTAGRPIPPRTP